MKNLLILSLLVSSLSFAQATAPVSPIFDSLKTTMRDMSKKLKTIAAQVNDPTKNADSEKLALELAKSTADAKLHIPASAADKAGQDLFVHMIDGVVQSANDLAAAFHENDNAKAITILNTMSQQKKDGHARFD